jgi:hypothetical protein
MKKNIALLVSIFLLFCIGIGAFTIQFVLNGCFWWECAPQRSFRIADLELPASLFPDGTIVNHVYPLSDEFDTMEDGSQSIYWNTGNAVYTIYRYPTIMKATVGFNNNKHLLVNSETGNAWSPPADLIFSSSTADAADVACGYWSVKKCAMVARYQEYVVFFAAAIDTKMTFAHFEKILFYIDNQMSSRLYP